MAAQPDAPAREATTASRPTSSVAPASGAEKDGRALAALIVGILSIPLTLAFWPIGLILAVVGIALGAVARGNIKRNGLAGQGQATAGMVCGIVAIALFVALIAAG